MFHLRDELANQPFGSRVKDVFANLGTGLIKHDSTDAEDTKNKDKPEDKHKRVKYSNDKNRPNLPVHSDAAGSTGSDNESGRSVEKEPEYEPFKRPNNWKKPAQLKRRGKFVPDHKKNPGKWTKYSLADVSPDQLSDKSNTRAALQFLSKLKDEKNGEKQEPADLTQRVVFKKRDKEDTQTRDSQEEKKFSGTVRVMPQCEIGRNKNKTEKSREKTKSNVASLKLSHLDEDEDEGDDCD